MTTTTNNTSIPAPYVRTSMRSLDRLKTRTTATAMITSGVTASAWMVGDRVPGSLALAAATAGAIGTLAIGVGPVAQVIADAAETRGPKESYLAPAIALLLGGLGVAAWSGLWLHLIAGVLGTVLVTAQTIVLLRSARTQLGKEWDR
jgi:hypothetical protein